jgi:hypothetical protein
MLLLMLACTGEVLDSAPEAPLLEPPDPSEGFQLSMTATAEPYSEVWACEVYPIPAEELSNVNWIEFAQNPGTHHMTLSAPSLYEQGTIEYGRHDCEELYRNSDLMGDATMFYGNQGTAEGEMHLPEGVAAQLPPNIDVLHEVHYVNPTDETVELYSLVNAYTIPSSEVTSGIWGGSVRDENIFIPPASTHTEWSRCVMNRDVEVLFLASHTHELGVNFEIRRFDGVDVGEVFYTNDDWHDPKIVQYEEPLVVPEGEGFEWACTWDNPSGDEITYGLTAADEMCNLAIVHTPFDLSALCEVVETSDGVLYVP